MLEINEGLEFLKSELEKYLSEVVNIIPKVSDNIESIQEIVSKGITIPLKNNLKTQNIYLHSYIHVLNFNYTNTINSYIPDNLEYNEYLKINNIHGQLYDPNNPIIFGYGYDSDNHYKLLEELKDNRFLNHVKSFDYLKTNNYRRLLEFVNQTHYDVIIMGHSCGLSDRVLLKTIFEHQHCMNIKIYYHKIDEIQNDYFFKTQEISRHFDDKLKFRSRIVPFLESKPLNAF